MPALPASPGGVVQSIQVLRGLAALAVVACHAVGRTGSAFDTGAAGVDVFFVISGFVMWTITASRPTQPGRFLLDRVTRVAPPYVLVTLAVFLLVTFVPAAVPNMRTSPSHALLSALFVPHLDPLGTEAPQVAPGWTLNTEMFFYAAVALTLALGASRRRRLLLLTILLVLLALLGMATVAGSAAWHAYTSPLLLEFVAGLWLGEMWRRRALPRAGTGWAMVAAGLAALVAWAVLQDALPGVSRPLVFGIPAALLVGGALAVERGGDVTPPRPLLLLGDASYAIYLTHFLVVGAAWRLGGGWPLPSYLLLAGVLSVLVGFAFRRLVEAPLTRAVRRALRRPPPLTAIPGATTPAPAPPRG